MMLTFAHARSVYFGAENGLRRGLGHEIDKAGAERTKCHAETPSLC
jgi:hypothetical protein